MPFAEFSADLRIGHDEIDGQHASLFEAINNLHDAMRSNRSRQVQAETLAFLNLYTVEHFKTEETLMRSKGYSGLVAHEAIHEDLVEQLKELEKKYDAGTMTLSIMTMHFLKDWLTDHIRTVDARFFDFLKQNEQS
ncbi:MAG: hemerythrin family protein [Holophaga sp.]|nr:hemerythrin family protein [Holophaga sp.]